MTEHPRHVRAHEPLTRNNITSASQVTLPLYALTALWFGLAYLLQDPRRTSTPAFAFIKEFAPLSTWAFMFLGLAAIKLAALITANRRLYILALCLGVGVWSVWTLGFTFALVDHDGFVDGVSFNAPAPWLFIVVGHIASLRSLTKD